MQTLHSSVVDLVGNTPLVELKRYSALHSLRAHLVAKVESFNPGGSVKDRIAKAMILQAEADGTLQSGSVIIEPTSGNTGIGLAMLAAVKGYRIMLVMPDTMSIERRNLLKAYGAELILTDGTKGMRGAMETAQRLCEEHPGSFMPSQFSNPANPLIHECTTGPEIWEATNGSVDAFIAGVGTGGTITGTGRFLKSKNPAVRIIAVEPQGSPVLSGGKPGPHKIQGIGAGFVPPVLDTTIYDEVMQVANDDALAAGREIARCEGLLVGISSGAALVAATKLAASEEFAEKTIVVLFPDDGDRYLSTALFADQ